MFLVFTSSQSQILKFFEEKCKEKVEECVSQLEILIKNITTIMQHENFSLLEGEVKGERDIQKLSFDLEVISEVDERKSNFDCIKKFVESLEENQEKAQKFDEYIQVHQSKLSEPMEKLLKEISNNDILEKIHIIRKQVFVQLGAMTELISAFAMFYSYISAQKISFFSSYLDNCLSKIENSRTLSDYSISDSDNESEM